MMRSKHLQRKLLPDTLKDECHRFDLNCKREICCTLTSPVTLQLFKQAAGNDKRLTAKELRSISGWNATDIINFIESGDLESSSPDSVLIEDEFFVALKKWLGRKIDAEIALVTK